jgi:hypothetical protein
MHGKRDRVTPMRTLYILHNEEFITTYTGHHLGVQWYSKIALAGTLLIPLLLYMYTFGELL